MKKITALLCASVMTLGLSSSVLAAGSITVPATKITATAPSGEKLSATSIKDLTTGILNVIVTDPDVSSIVDMYLNGDPDKAYDLIKKLAGDNVLTEDENEIDLDDYEPVDVLSLIDTKNFSVNQETGEIEVVTDFEMSEGKTIDDYLVCVINPAADPEDEADAETEEAYTNAAAEDEDPKRIAFVEPVLDDEYNFTYDLGYYPALVQILETV